MKYEKIKILRTITWLPVGGIEKRILKVLPILNKPPFELSVCCLRERGELADKLEEQGIKVHLIPFKTRLDPFALYKLAKLIKSEKYHILHSHMYRSNIPTTIAGKIARSPVIISQIHNINTWETRRQKFLDKFLCRYRNGIIAVSEEVKNDIINKLCVPQEFCKVIYNGVESDKFGNLSKNKNILKPLGISENDCVIITAARLVEQKNHKASIKAFSKISKICPDCKMIFAGSGKLEDNLKNMVNELSLGNKIFFLGKRDDIPEILAASDIFLMPSYKEGFSNAILEAMASELPVIISDIGCNREAVKDGDEGFLIKPDNIEQISEKILTLVNNAKLRKETGAKAKARAQMFSIDKMVENLQNYYLSLLETNS